MLNVKIITPSGLYLETISKMVNIRTIDGQQGILPNHLPLVTMLEISTLSIDGEDGVREVYTISGGMFYLDDQNNISILTDSIENIKDIDVNRAKLAKDNAEKDLNHYQQGKEYTNAEAALKRAVNRIHATELL